MAFWQDHFRHGTHRHQDDRYQRGPDADAKTRHLFFREGFRAVQTFRDRLINPFQEAGINRAGQDHRRDCQNRTEQQGFTHIGMEDGGDRGWTRVWWQETVRNGQRGGHRYTDIQQWNVRCRCDGEHQWQHQHEAHFIEQCETDGKPG